jgi:hypothetical protein
MDPAGKVAIVTGGNSGLGAAAAAALATCANPEEPELTWDNLQTCSVRLERSREAQTFVSRLCPTRTADEI